jgi:predicted nucleotidyltransferase
MPEVAKPKSPRRVVVVENATDLIRIGAALGARRVALCGSVARCEDIDDSDIDFYVFDFRLTESLDNLDRANQLVSKYRRLLKP